MNDTQTAAVRAVARARRRRERAEDDLHAAILAARAAGASLQSIADAAGITRQRIHQIVGKAAGVSRNRVWQIERGL